MIKHTFFNKCNTIIENSNLNTGLNPVVELNVGNKISRILINFDLSTLKEQVNNGDLNISNLKHKIHMTNCGNINLPIFNENLTTIYGNKKRASSFDIIAFKLPISWDEGRGFDYNGDYIKETNKIVSKDGSTWFQSKNGINWNECGVYSNNTLLNDYENDKMLIIGEQHFDYGTENIDIDVTEYINNILVNNIEFNGIGLSFSPKYENETQENRFISFFSNHTNTFFTPYLETINNDYILDDRANFHLGIKNRLYFFVIDDGEYVNLDVLPTCTIDGVNYEVKQSGKGVYYIETLFKTNEIEPYTILYDTWSNLVINGNVLNDIEMEFVVLPMENKIFIGKHNTYENKYVPQISGINDKEDIEIGDIREVMVDFIEEYSYGKKNIPSISEYRIYVKENDKEIDVFPYQIIERKFDEHSFVINTNDLIPNQYHVDIRIKQGKNLKHFKNVLEFSIISNITNYYK